MGDSCGALIFLAETQADTRCHSGSCVMRRVLLAEASGKRLFPL